MRKLLISVCLCAVARLGVCGSAQVIDVSLPLLRTSGTSTLVNVKGYVDSIQIFPTDGYSTGTCSIVALPLDPNGKSFNVIGSTACSNAARLFRPRVDGTTTVGADNTSDPPERFYLWGETLRFSVYSATSNRAWRARVKVSDF